jgi:hypothetical protein
MTIYFSKLHVSNYPTNWEGVSVTPDIAAAPDKALAVAKDLLRRRLQGSAPLVAAGH